MKRSYCTYFDRNYLVRVTALIESLNKHEQNDFELFAVCHDEISRLLLEKLNLPNVTAVPIHKIEQGDTLLTSTKTTRSLVEYYWTAGPSLILWILEHYPQIDVLTYIDSDLFFYSSPDPIFDELGDNSVLIHEHRFPASLMQMEMHGKYNVGLLCFRNDQTGQSVLKQWRQQCIEWCYVQRSEDGKFGDQVYLNDWPAKFQRVKVLQNVGAGVAPWNHIQYHYNTDSSGRVSVNGSPLIFYHFHELKFVNPDIIVPFHSYPLLPIILNICYLPYMYALHRAIAAVRQILPNFNFGLENQLDPSAKGETSPKGGQGKYNFITKNIPPAEMTKYAIAPPPAALDNNWNCYCSHNIAGQSDSNLEFRIKNLEKTERRQFSILNSQFSTPTGIVIATSIAPKEIDKQKRAVNSWHKLGLNVISVNNPGEIEILQRHFPSVNFVEAKRNATALIGKPYIYIDDILEQLNAAGCQICGIVNSDIYIAANEDTVSFIRKEAENSFVYGSRVEVDSLDNLNGELYDRGFDFFFFDKSLLPLFPKSDFCIGATWWDYWLPLVSILSGCRTKMFVTPFAAHVRHRYKWDEKQWLLLAGKIYDYITEKVREHSFTAENAETAEKNSKLNSACSAVSAVSTRSLDLAARMISAHAYFIIKRNKTVRNKDEYRKFMCQSCGKAVLEFLKIESKKIGQASVQPAIALTAEIYEGRDNTVGLSFDEYQKALDLNQQGETLVNSGNIEKALTAFEQAVRIVPNLTTAYNNLGILLSKQKPTTSLKYFMKALQVDPLYTPAVNNAAELLLHSGRSEMARNFTLGSAELCVNFGMPAKAIEIYKAYLQKCPADAVISGELKKLESVKPPEYDGVPLVFVNWGDGKHLKYVLAQAYLFNHKSKIYLIGDQTNDKYDFVEHYDYTRFNSSAQRFAPLYKHLSPNTYSFELGCFLRWFIIRDFLKEMKLTGCVALDSDVMVYTTLSNHWYRFANFGMTAYGSVCPHCNFISDVNLLSEFCDFIIHNYTDSACLKQMEDFYAPRRGKGIYGISDMILFQKFGEKFPDRIGDLRQNIGGSVFDGNISCAEGTRDMESGKKKIYWVANSPQAKLAATGDLVAYEILHFQGPSKIIIPNYFMGELQLSPQGRWNVRKDGDIPYIVQMDKKPAIDYIVKPSVPGPEEAKYLITAIVSTYNSENFIRGCLEDLENQTIADKIEIIVVDSASLQDEESIVREFQKRYNNIVYIRTRKREGLYLSWNRAIKAARGQFLTSANTDDRHRRDAFAIMANALLADPNVALVYADQFVTDTPNPTFENHNLIKTAQQPDFSRQRLLFGCCVGSQPMWRKQLHDEFGGFDETLTCAADWDFWLKTSSKYCFKHIPQVLGLYYQNQQGIEHGHKIHSLYERYLVGKRYGNPYISIIQPFTTADNPLISIWMAAYNAQDYITEAIESVLIQNYRNFELLIVDDGSTDRTADIVRSFKDEHIKYFRKEHGGLASARNVQLQKSNGSFIVILDSDDIMTPDFLARHLLEFQRHPETDLVYCDDLLIDQDNKPIRIINRPEYRDGSMPISDLFRCGFPVVPFRTCIKKSVFDKIGPYDEQLLVAEDYDMLRRFVREGFKIHHLPATLYLRRINTKSHSRRFDAARAKCQLEAVRRFTETFTPEQLFPDVRWNELPAGQKLLLAKCKAAGVYMGIGEQYLKTNIHEYASAGFELGCAELDQCCQLAPANQQIKTLMEQCRSIRAQRLAIASPVNS